MKKLNFIRKGFLMPLFILLCTGIKAQEFSFTQSMDSLLSPLDKSRIPTGILYERVMPLANIDLYNVAAENPPPCDYHFLRQAYFELYHAAYNNSAWLKPEWLKTWADGEAYEKKYTVGVLDYRFNMIDSNALANGWLSFSGGLFHDVPGAPSPYLPRRVQMAAILADEIPTGIVSLYFNAGFIRSNQSLQVISISLNFGSIGAYTLSSANHVAQVNFTGSGVKQFTTTIQYADGSNFINTSEIQVGANTAPYANKVEGTGVELPDVSFWISGKYPFQGYKESYPAYGKAKISIWWKRNAQNQPEPGIKKPVIIVDGIDALNTRKDTGIYKLFSYFDQNSNPQDFAFELRRQGFDIIVMDMPTYKQTVPGTINDPGSSLTYPKPLYDEILPDSLKHRGLIFGGADYIQRNAYVLEALIDYCNQQMGANGSNEKQVLVGPSMGGQITRYALRDMELQGQNHNCRLWVSFDSNHEGAYVPVGIQYSMAKLSANSEEAMLIKEAWVGSPTAKQTTIHHYLANSETVKGAPDFYDRYYNEINNPAFGFPQSAGLRKIAMISGSDLGVPQTFGSACQLATEFEIKFKPRGFLNNLVAIVLSPLIGWASALNPIQKHSTYLAPATGFCTVFNFRTPFSNYSKRIFAPSWSNTSLDMLQGGFFPAFNEYWKALDSTNEKKLFSFWYKFLTATAKDYIGNGVQQLTYSTLALGLGSMPNLNRKWDENFRKDALGQATDVTCPETKESPFDMYWSPDINTRHDSLLLGHVARLRKEIIDKQAWPRTQLQRTATISGSKNLLCAGDTATFSINNPLPGMVYNWTTQSSFLQIISGQGTPTVTIKHNGSTTISGYYSINCTASSPCYIINTLYFRVFAGKPLLLGYYNSPSNSSQPLVPYKKFDFFTNDICYSRYITTNMEIPPGAAISWSYAGSSNNTANWWPVGNNIRFYLDDINQWIQFTATISNQCGYSYATYRFTSVAANCSGPVLKLNLISGGSYGTFQCYVSSDKFNKGGNSSDIYAIRVIDKMGIMRKEIKYDKGVSVAALNLADLNTDVYIIMAFDGHTWYHAKIINQ